MGASLYACLTGDAPPAAEERMEKDRFVSSRRAAGGRFSAELLDTVDWCLRMDHLERPQSVFALQKSLLGEKPPDYRGSAPVLEQLKGALRKLSRR